MARSFTGPVTAVLALVLGGCPGGVGGASAQKTVEGYRQRLELQVDGQTVVLPVTQLDVFLVEDERQPESFHLHGPGLSLGGEIPPDRAIGYGDDWSRLVGKPIEVAAQGGDPGAPQDSVVTLPGSDAPTGARGTLTIRTVGTSWAAKTPLEGDVELKLDGDRTLKGKLFVLGTSWG